MVISFISLPAVYAESEIKDIDNLIIYIKNKEYDKKNVFLKDGVIYTSLASLGKTLTLNYEYKEEKLYINGMEYSGNYYAKGQYVYVPLKEMCEYLGYYVDYNSSTNIMDISGKPIPAYEDIVPQNPEQTPVGPQTSGGGTGIIIPGSGIDGVAYLGVTMNDIKARWGEPEFILNVDASTQAYFYGEMAFIPGEGGNIYCIMLLGNTYKTARGICVGSTLKEVTAVFGEQYVTSGPGMPGGSSNGDTINMYYPEGIGFAVDKQTQKVVILAIFAWNYL